MGSTFQFTLRVVQQAQPRAHGPDEPVIPGVDVVVVNSDPVAQETLDTLLGNAGYRIQPVLDSRQTIATIQQTRPRLTILAPVLADGDGWEILAEVRSTPDIAAIPVIMHAPQPGTDGVLLDASAYLVKPVPEEALLAVVGEWASPSASIVVIDDDPDARLIMRSILGEAGYTVVDVADGPAGLQAIQSVHPALVLLDLLMPEMDGFAVLEQIRSGPDADLPVVLISAKDLEPSEQRWLRARTQAHFAHCSADGSALLRTIERVLRQGGTYAP